MEAGVQPGSEAAEQTYEALAPVYDDFTSHHDYGLWLGNLLPELHRHGLSGNRLLDVACGTGKSFMPMLADGWDVTGCDISASMIARARAKVGDAARLSVADMRELPLFGEFDLVWCLDDALNYVLSAEEFVQALHGMRDNLAAEGLLMFDVNTILTYRTFFAEVERAERGGKRFVWRGLAATDVAPGSICESRLEVEDEEGGEAIETNVHRQRHYPEAQVLEMLRETGLEALDVIGHGYDAVLQRPVDELRHTKMVYIARPAQA
jgi:SAM-dependent methyltransferase